MQVAVESLSELTQTLRFLCTSLTKLESNLASDEQDELSVFVLGLSQLEKRTNEALTIIQSGTDDTSVWRHLRGALGRALVVDVPTIVVEGAVAHCEMAIQTEISGIQDEPHWPVTNWVTESDIDLALGLLSLPTIQNSWGSVAPSLRVAPPDKDIEEIQATIASQLRLQQWQGSKNRLQANRSWPSSSVDPPQHSSLSLDTGNRYGPAFSTSDLVGFVPDHRWRFHSVSPESRGSSPRPPILRANEVRDTFEVANQQQARSPIASSGMVSPLGLPLWGR